MVSGGASVALSRRYRLGPGKRLANALFAGLTRHGRGAHYRHLLSVPGRRSGEIRSTPVDVMHVDGSPWVVAPYGEVNWVKNVRAAGTLRLSRGKRAASYRADEVDAAAAGPVIRRYVETVPITRAYWDVTPSSSDDDFVREAVSHPVFRLSSVTTHH